MKNIALNSANNVNYNPESSVEYLIMKWELDYNKAYLSLQSPETANEAFDNLQEIILKNKKFWDYLNIWKDNPQVFYKIIYEAINHNRPIEDQIALFLKQSSPKTAWAKVEVWMELWKYANRAYRKVSSFANNENYTWWADNLLAA